MNKAIVATLSLIILSGCNLVSLTSDDKEFKLKQTCFEQSKETLEKFQTVYDSMEVFYSPRLNTCIFAYWEYENVEIFPGQDRSVPRHTIKDLLSGKIIFRETNAPLWQEKVDELKK